MSDIYVRTPEYLLGKGGVYGVNGLYYDRNMNRAAINNFNLEPGFQTVPVIEVAYPGHPGNGTVDEVRQYVNGHPQFVLGRLASARFEDMGEWDDDYFSFDVTKECWDAILAGKLITGSYGIDMNFDGYTERDGIWGLFQRIGFSHFSLLGAEQPAFIGLDELQPVVAGKGCGREGCQRFFLSEAFPLTLQGGKEVAVIPQTATPATPAAPAPAAPAAEVAPAAPATESAPAVEPTPAEKGALAAIWSFFEQMVGLLKSITAQKAPAPPPATTEGMPPKAAASCGDEKPATASKPAAPPPAQAAATAEVTAEVEQTETVPVKDMTPEQKLEFLDKLLDLIWDLRDRLEKMRSKTTISNAAEGLQAIIDTTPTLATKAAVVGTKFGDPDAVVASKPAVPAAGYAGVPIAEGKPNYDDKAWWEGLRPLESMKDAEAIVTYLASRGSKGTFTQKECEQTRLIKVRTMGGGK